MRRSACRGRAWSTGRACGITPARGSRCAVRGGRVVSGRCPVCRSRRPGSARGRRFRVRSERRRRPRSIGFHPLRAPCTTTSPARATVGVSSGGRPPTICGPMPSARTGEARTSRAPAGSTTPATMALSPAGNSPGAGLGRPRTAVSGAAPSADAARASSASACRVSPSARTRPHHRTVRQHPAALQVPAHHPVQRHKRRHLSPGILQVPVQHRHIPAGPDARAHMSRRQCPSRIQLKQPRHQHPSLTRRHCHDSTDTTDTKPRDRTRLSPPHRRATTPR